MKESFSEFKNSFSYGTRADLNFKFLAGLSDEEAAKFMQTLFIKTIDAMDGGDWASVSQLIIDAQIQNYNKDGRFVYEDGPFSAVTKPLSEMKIGLLTSSGHFVDGDDPNPFGIENMSQMEAMARIQQFLKEAPQLSSIPVDTPQDKLRVRHGGYDIRGAQMDADVVLPIKTLTELMAEGEIGELHSQAYTFVGACAQTPLKKKVAPQWAAMLKEQQIDAMLLVPA